MARKRNPGLAGDIFALGGALPWWVSLPLAAIVYGILHQIATQPAPLAAAPGQAGAAVATQFLLVLARLGQYVIPLFLALGALVSLMKRQPTKAVFRQRSRQPANTALDGLSWVAFERLVGEAFRQRGYSVAETHSGADGGVDLRLVRNRERFLVQCKHWRAQKVPVEVVRELYGAMAAEGAAGGFVVTSGEFTAPAQRFARGRNIELLDRTALSAMITAAQSGSGSAGSAENPPQAPASPAVPTCPQCGAVMVRRLARKGANAGNAFWGCSGFPHCRGIRPLQ